MSHRVNSKKGFSIYFDTINQVYNVYKDGKFLIGNKAKFSEVKCYLS